MKKEIHRAKRIWSQRQSQSARGLWNAVKTLKGTRPKDPWRQLLEESGSLDDLLTRLTTEFCKNYNSDDDVELLPLLGKDWVFHVSPSTVFYHLSKLSNRKAAGPDGIPPRLLKAGARYLCSPLATILNLSIKTKTFPSCFKLAHVCPIPKCNNPSVNDFRPIFLLSCISKVFERIVLDNVRSQLYQCYGPHQHAYRPLSSTTTALIEVCEYITQGLDCNETSHVNVFCIDLSRAFDKIHHHRLLNYLLTHGLNNGFLEWLRSYLCSRTFRVDILNRLGPLVKAPSGVPQGSVLGPFLFAAFMGSFTFGRDNACIRSTKYADDVTIVETVTHNQVSSISLDDCISIFHEGGLLVNRSKCKQLCVRRSQKGFYDYNCGFVRVNSLKILGVIFDDHFKWKAQISNILKLASQRLHVIRCLKTFITPSELTQVYHGIITSLLKYASPVYGQLPATLLAKLEKFQRRGHRLICGPSCRCDAFPSLDKEFEDAAMRLLEQAEAHRSHSLHSFVPGRLPASNQLRLPPCKTRRRSDSFIPWASRLCNKGTSPTAAT